MTQFRCSLWLSNIHFAYMCCILSIQSSVNGHLGCSHVLAIVTSAAMNAGVHNSKKDAYRSVHCILMFGGHTWPGSLHEAHSHLPSMRPHCSLGFGHHSTRPSLASPLSTVACFSGFKLTATSLVKTKVLSWSCFLVFLFPLQQKSSEELPNSPVSSTHFPTFS